jgi:hypothetical protein
MYFGNFVILNVLLPSIVSLYVDPSNFFNKSNIGICGIDIFSVASLCKGTGGISNVK